MSSSASIFPQTRNMKTAVELMNNIEKNIFIKILKKVIIHMKEKSSAIFSPSDFLQLCTHLSLTSVSLNLLLESLLYVYEMAAYHALSAEKFDAALKQIDVADQQRELMLYVWQEQRDDYLTQLRDITFGTPLVLSDVDTRTAISICTDNYAKQKDIHTILTLQLQDNNQLGQEDKQNSTSSLCVELDASSLQKLYDNLESIQQQLDELTDK